MPVVSFTFGLPRPADLAALRRAGSRLLVTVTTVSEARAAAEAGADGLVVQGSDAGGHSGTHDPYRTIVPTRTDELTRAVGQATGLPLVATGGVDGPAAVAALLDAGAGAVAVGTLLLRTDESGASKTYQDALADPGFAALFSPGPSPAATPAGCATSSSPTTTPARRPAIPRSIT